MHQSGAITHTHAMHFFKQKLGTQKPIQAHLTQPFVADILDSYS